VPRRNQVVFAEGRAYAGAPALRQEPGSRSRQVFAVRQLTCTAPGRLEWREVAAPELGGPGEALIRPVAVARSEIDPVLIGAGPTSPDGFAVGHEAVAEVVQAGSDVSGCAAGQLVFPSFQLCCGRCRACRSGRTANCAAYPVLSDYGMQPRSGVEYGGMLSDLVRIPHADAMLVPVPAGQDPVRLASVADNVCDGSRFFPRRAGRGTDAARAQSPMPEISWASVQTTRSASSRPAPRPPTADLAGIFALVCYAFGSQAG
jgi:hypothetical protein